MGGGGRRAETGIATGLDPAPYGYRRGQAAGDFRVLLYEPEARIVRMIFEWYVKELGPEWNAAA